MDIRIRVSGYTAFAFVGDKIVGTLLFDIPDDEAGLRNLDIVYLETDISYRRKGVATALLEYIMEYFRNQVWISFWTGKQAEIDKSYVLFEKLGFKQLAYQEDYYDDGIGTRLFARRMDKEENNVL